MSLYAHRNGASDLDWAAQQPKGKPHYVIGDVVQCHAGGVGVVDEVNLAHDGWPNTYAVSPIDGYSEPPYHAWFYEGDFARLVARSPVWALTR